MKKLLTLLLALSMCCTAFVSCGEDTDNSSNSGSQGSQTAEEDTLEPLTEITLPISEEPMSFTQWRVWSSDYMTNYGETTAIQKLEEMTNIHVDYTCVPSTAGTEKYGLMLASGDFPDMIYDGGTTPYPGGEEAGIDDGVLRDLTHYVEYYMPNYRNLIATNEDVRQVVVTDEGNNVGAYMIRTRVDGANHEVVIENEPCWAGMAIRQDWLDELNMEIPTTIDELHDVLVAFKDNYGGTMDLYSDGTLGYDCILSAYGVTSDFYMNNGKVAYGPTTDAYKEYVTLMRDWYAEGLINPDFITNTGWYLTSDNTNYANDVIGVGIYLHGFLGSYLYDTGATANEDFYLSPMVAPVLNEGDPVVTTYQALIALQPVYATTSVTDEEMPYLAQWIDYHYTYDWDVMCSYGLEGDSYTVDENSEWYYVFTDKVTHPETPGMTTTSALAFVAPSFDIGYMDWRSTWQNFELSGNDWSQKGYETWGQQTDAIMLPAGASFTAEESQEYDDIFLDIDTYVQEMTVSFIMGTRDIDAEWDTFINTINGMNIDRCIELKQTSVDRYTGKEWKLADLIVESGDDATSSSEVSESSESSESSEAMESSESSSESSAE